MHWGSKAKRAALPVPSALPGVNGCPARVLTMQDWAWEALMLPSQKARNSNRYCPRTLEATGCGAFTACFCRVLHGIGKTLTALLTLLESVRAGKPLRTDPAGRLYSTRARKKRAGKAVEAGSRK